ncbi:hypothetical protein OIU78_021998 [Salix suchowensis]|nr:hypothetical protein OIU78_021998 [Salix suchowensis]
MPAPPF